MPGLLGRSAAAPILFTRDGAAGEWNGVTVIDDFAHHPTAVRETIERFRQEDATTNRTASGLGLGLSIAKNLVELHGGVVSASSNGPDTGATFRVRLPVMIVHPPLPPEQRVHPRHERRATVGPLPDLKGTHVLAVDDEPDSLRLLTEILEAAGARVTTARSGAAVESARPDVILADLGMPLMDGFELIERLRQSPNEYLRQIPAAALTAYGRTEDRAKTLQAGFEMHLAKPIDPGELVASIATLAKRVSSESSAGTSTPRGTLRERPADEPAAELP